MGEIAALVGCQVPFRVKCASMPWHPFMAALRDEGTDT